MDWDSYKNKKSKPTAGPEALEEFFNNFFNKPGTLIKALIVLIIVFAAYSSFYTVNPKEKAVVTRFGKYLTTSNEGLHFKFPLGIDRVIFVPTRIQKETFGFTTNDSNSRSSFANISFQSKRYPSSVRTTQIQNESLMLTGDLNVADVQWVVQYKVIVPRDYLFNVANPVKNIRDIAQTVMRRVVGDVSINDVLTTGKARVESEVKLLMQSVTDEYGMGVSIEQVNLQDVNPPGPVQDSFNEVNSALQEQKQVINRAEANKNKIIPEAKGRAEEQISIAEGYAKAVVNRAKGDSDKFKNILTEYRKAPEITRTRLYLEVVEELLGRTGSFTVVDPEVKGLLPVFSGGGETLPAKDARAQLKRPQQATNQGGK